jgi:sugar phosphate isomerase/epimerase
MEIKFFCPLWGLVSDYIHQINQPLEEIFRRIKNAGYDGIEMAIPFSDKEKSQIARLLKKYSLELIALQWAATGNSLQEYIISYQQHMRNAAEVNPLFINSHTGRDYYPFDDICSILDSAIELYQNLNVKIVHETHRGRFSFHAALIQPYFGRYPDLRITADFSHWCNVSETFLQDQKQSLQAAIQKADHIHARVGHQQSCQVSDPRAPEWQQALNYHLEWWDAIVEYHEKAGTRILTVTPEFGPGNYMPLLPYTKQPVADQWEINNWMKNLLKKRYGKHANAKD